MLPLLCDPSAEDEVILAAVVEHYASRLVHSAPGSEWLAHHGIDQTLAQTLRIGARTAPSATRCPRRTEGTGQRCVVVWSSWACIRSSGHEHFVGSIVVPVLDADGKITQLFGRRFGRGHEPLWAKGLPGGIFHEGALHQEDIVVVPSVPDALGAPFGGDAQRGRSWSTPAGSHAPT